MATRGIREPFSALSHYAGAVATVAGLCYLFTLAWGRGLALAAFGVYGASVTFLYVASGLYHSLHSRSPWLQRFDHMAIYFMIAGTYTPVCLLAVRGRVGIAMLAAEWAMAAIGVVANIRFGGGPKRLRLVLYLLMGWLIVLDLPRVSRVLPASALLWMLAGGLAFTIGTIIYATNRPKLWPGKFGAHELWHVFVLGGSACHYVLMISTARLA